MSCRITGLSSMATRRVLADLATAHAARGGRPVAITSLGGVEAARRIRAGEATDLVVLASGVMAQLEAEGHLVPGSRADFARSGIAVAVPAGAARPAIDDADAVRRAILGAGRIGVSTGPSGDHLARLAERWGIAAEVAGRLVRAPPGVPVGSLLAQGTIDLGFQQRSELLDLPGIEVLGPLPAGIQAVTVFSAGVSRTAPDPEGAGAVVAYLTSADAVAAKVRNGLEPA
ncbi:MAG: substrate-binding domain-containing protein [Methylobacterium frigidaeris]